MSPIFWRPPTQMLMADTEPVSPGGNHAGWVSGTVRNALGGARSGSGLVAGAVTIAGGAITAVAAPINGGNGYPASARFEVEVQGNGFGARVFAITNSAGVVTSFLVANGGQGYSAASLIQRAASYVDVLFDCGPAWHQYPIGFAVINDMWLGFVGLLSVSASTNHLTGFLPCIGLSGSVEAYFTSLEYSGNPARAFTVQSRFVRLRYVVAATIGSSAQVGLGLRAA